MNHSERFSLQGRRALITGSAQGLGYTMATGLMAAGAEIILSDLNAERVGAAAAALRQQGGIVSTAVFDVAKPAEVKPAVAAIERTTGPIDILINNAGIHRYAALADMDIAHWQQVIDVNLTGAFVVAQAVAQGMIARQSGKIINVCSLMSEATRPSTANYTAAKGGLKMLTKSMCVEWGRFNIQANGIGPGYILSDMTKHLAEKPEFDSWVKSRTPAGRWGTPDDLIGAAVFLASPAANFVNGQVLYVDGGWLAGL
jgi:gluconate 5-dehydrogenase